jgi:opacity protein-like surface antigen
MKKLTAVAVLAAAAISVLVAVQVAGATSAKTAADPASCQLGNGVKHVINIVFDNVHFFRDNPNVKSDLEQMPNLLNFLESNGTVFSNTHTPLIAHTADDSLSIYTGLYGDRHGQPLTNTYNVYNPNGTTDTATSFTYWTSPIIDTKPLPSIPSPVDSAPSMTYSDTVPASGPPNRATPAPWVPFTRAGCTVGDFSTANMVLENAAVDVPTAFGAGSDEAIQTATDPDKFKNLETAQYVGEAIHCAQGAAICADSPNAVADALPDEPRGYDGYQALFGAKYVAPAIGGGDNVTHDGFPVTDANGNLTDLDGNTMVEPHSLAPGFPGFSPTASQSLAAIADMQEAGIPVTYAYISDLHDKKANASGCTSPGNALGPGDACYVAALHDYDRAFGQWFQRLADDGITPANTEFVIGAEENDQFAGANVGRATEPTPAGCDGVTIACHYTSTQDGELNVNVKGLLSTTASAGTQFDVQPQGASLYVHGQPGANDPTVRQLERDTAAMTSNLTYSGVPNEKIAQYQADQVEQRILHMQTNDPLRTPTYSIFPMPDYFFGANSGTVSFNNGFAYDHGYYSPNIDITWVGMVGPGVANNQVDGPGPAGGNESQDPNSTKTVPEASKQGTWVEEADIRPTLLYLLGLKDDYESDGHVITQALAPGFANPALQATAELAKGYDQINSSVGPFATDTLIADTKALATGSASDDSTYEEMQSALQQLADDRDTAAAPIKKVLNNAADGVMPNHGQITSGLAHVRELLLRAVHLAGS